MALEKRRIAVVIPKYGLVGGAERFVAELTERLACDPRYEVHVLANRWQKISDRIIFHPVPILSFPKYLTTASFAWFVQRTLSRFPVDLIHTHDRIFHGHIFTMHGIPHQTWVNEIRGKRHPSLYDRVTCRVERQLVEDPACRWLLAVSELTKETFLNVYDIDPERVRVIHPGVDVEKFSRPDRQRCRREIRLRFGIAETDTVILFVSMNFDVKGLDPLIRAMAAAHRMRPEGGLKLLIVGKGREMPYRQLAQELGVGEHIIFAGVEKKNLENIYRACDIFSILSKFDTFGMTVLEAMAAGLPVLISDHVGARDLVRPGENGYVVTDTTDAEGMGAKIDVMTNPAVRGRMGKAARETAGDHTWEDKARQVHAIYESMLTKPLEVTKR